MDGIKQQIQAKQVEAINTRHMHETRKQNRAYRAELDNIKSSHTDSLKRIKKEFSKTELDEQNKLEAELTTIRKKNNQMIKDENIRFKQMTEEIKMAHQDKMGELKVSQDKEVEREIQEHTDYLENARTKFESEKMKIEA